MEFRLACSMPLDGLHRVWIRHDLQSFDNRIHPFSRQDKCNGLVMTRDADGTLFSFLQYPGEIRLSLCHAIRIFHEEISIRTITPQEERFQRVISGL